MLSNLFFSHTVPYFKKPIFLTLAYIAHINQNTKPEI